MKIQTLEIEDIRIDGGTQSRVEINTEVVSEYAELLKSGIELPPVTVFCDGFSYWLADGFHRYWAHNWINNCQITAEVHQGSRRDAILYSVGANARHGLRRTNADKRKAVGTLLKDAEWSNWSSREIARRCGVSNGMVDDYRRSMPGSGGEISQPRYYVTKHGTIARMNTAKIGNKKTTRKSDGPKLDTLTTVRECGTCESRAALELTYDPRCAAHTIISAMGEPMSLNIAHTIISVVRGNDAIAPK